MIAIINMPAENDINRREGGIYQEDEVIVNRSESQPGGSCSVLRNEAPAAKIVILMELVPKRTEKLYSQ